MATPLHQAMMINGSVQYIQSLISRGADINAKDHEGNTLLHLAISKHNVEIVQCLIENGASIDCTNASQQTPLHCALEVYKANVIAYNHEGTVQSDFATSDDKASIIRLLLQNGASVNCKDDCEQTPLHRALALNAGLNIVELLLKSGADTSAKDRWGETPFHMVVSKNNLVIIRLFIEHGASVDCKDQNRQTPLQRAMIKESMEIVKLLLSNGADANAKDREGNRPLHCTLRRWGCHPSEFLLRMLLVKGAHVNARNNEGESAFFCALMWAHVATITELLKFGVELDDPKVRELSAHAKLDKRSQCVWWEYLFKLLTANFKLHGEYTAFINRHRIYNYNPKSHENCLREVEMLKSTLISEQKSLYDFIHMHPTRRGAYTNSQQLQQVLQSPSFKKTFPLYKVVIMASFLVTKRRMSLLERALESWYALTQGRLPDVIDHILDYLGEHDLLSIVEANSDGGAADDQ